MAKSLRSKCKKRLRTLRREIVEPHYEKKALDKIAILEAAIAAPKVEVHSSKASSSAMEIEPAEITSESRGRSGPTKMNVDDDGLYYGVTLKPKGGIKKRRKSRGRIKKEKHKQKKQKF